MPLNNGQAAYDPNDPNQDSQAQPQQVQDALNSFLPERVQNLNQQLAGDSRVTDWLAQHGDGQRDLSEDEKAQYVGLIKSLGYPVNDTMTAGSRGTMIVNPDDTGNNSVAWRNLALVAAVPLAVWGASAAAGALGGAAPAAPAATTGTGVASSLAEPALTSGLSGGLSAGALDSAALAGAAPAGITAGTTAGTVAGLDALPASTSSLSSVPTLASGANPAITAATSAGTGGGLLSTIGKNASMLGAAGQAVGNATQAAGNNRMTAAQQAITGQSAYEQELNNRAKTDATQRADALKNIYRASFFNNVPTSPYNTKGNAPISQQTLDTLNSLAAQGTTRLANASPYDMNTTAPLTPYSPSQPGTLEQVGTYAAPALSILSTIGKYYGK